MAAKRKYVFFNDSFSDPTYLGAEEVYLVLSEGDYTEGNPCVHESAKVAPIIPVSPEELKRFAKFFGFKVVTIDGVLHLKTRMKEKE